MVVVLLELRTAQGCNVEDLLRLGLGSEPCKHPLANYHVWWRLLSLPMVPLQVYVAVCVVLLHCLQIMVGDVRGVNIRGVDVVIQRNQTTRGIVVICLLLPSEGVNVVVGYPYRFQLMRRWRVIRQPQPWTLRVREAFTRRLLLKWRLRRFYSLLWLLHAVQSRQAKMTRADYTVHIDYARRLHISTEVPPPPPRQLHLLLGLLLIVDIDDDDRQPALHFTFLP